MTYTLTRANSKLNIDQLPVYFKGGTTKGKWIDTTSVYLSIRNDFRYFKNLSKMADVSSDHLNMKEKTVSDPHEKWERVE